MSVDSDVETLTARLTQQVRQMTAANDALRAANATLIDANTHLRLDVAELATSNEELRVTGNEQMYALRAELHKLATVLQAERAQLRIILAGIEEAVLVVDQAGTPVRMNAAYAELFDNVTAALRDVQGQLLLPDQTPRARAARGETFTLSFTLTTGVPSMWREDTRRWFEATGQPLQEGGSRYGIVSIRDTTLSNQHRRLEDEFLTRASHELRTPLTSIQGFLDLLVPLLHGEGDERLRLYATSALHDTRRLVALVRDLTDVGRLQRGKLTLDLGPTYLTAVVAHVVDAVQALSPGHAIRLAAGAAPVWVRGDAGRLEQVLFNLLTNAITHAPSRHAIDVRLTPVGSEVKLEVQDYGRGIAADQLPHLFARFYQVPSADRSSRGGFGLGLFICRELIVAHGGRIEVASIVGEGTTFTVWLPLLESGTIPQ